MNLPNNHDLLSQFTSFLVESGLSAVSIKNYLSDLRHFIRFLESVEENNLSKVFQNISKYIKEYLDEQKSQLTPLATSNRRLASIRRFSTFLKINYKVETDQNTSPSTEEAPKADSNKQTAKGEVSSQKILDQFRQQLINEKKTNSTVKNYLSDLYHYFSWIAKHTPFNTHHLDQVLSNEQLQGYITYQKLVHTSTSVISRRQSSIKKLTHYCFDQKFISHDPFEVVVSDTKISPLAWFSRFSKPKTNQNAPKSRLAVVYHKYNSLSFTPYLHLALLVLATTTMAILGYNQLIKQAKPSSAASSLTQPRRQLSFQGRLSDSSGTPINTSVNLNFKLWDDDTVGSQLYTSGTCPITPDADGVFNSLIGDGVCGAEIPMSVFADNRDVYLEVTVGAETLTPRQQIATVGYALNSETLQGYPASAAATINTVPVVDNSGNINIAAASPAIISSSGNFNIQGQSLSLTTATNSGGDIVLQPDAIGSGQVFVLGGTTTEDTFRITNSNLTSGSLVSAYIGNDTATGSGNLLLLSSGATESARFRVTADGRTTISTATASANTAALVVDQNGTGSLFSASSSGVTKFNIANNGSINNINGVSHLISDSSGNLALASDSNTILLNDNVTFAGTTTLNGQTYTWPASGGSNTYVLQTNGSGTLSWVAQGGGISSYWDLANGVIFPTNSTADFLLGGQATSSAKFAVLNMDVGTPIASISANSGNNATYLTGDGALATTNKQSLNIGETDTGNITIGANSQNVAIDSNVWDITGAGVVSGLTGLTSSGTINFSGLTPSRAIFTDGSSNLVTSGASADLLASLSDETGTGVAVFGTSPTFTTDIRTPLIIGSTSANGTLTLQGNNTTGNTATDPNLIFKVGDSGGTTAMTILNNGNVGIGVTNPTSKLQVGGASSTISNDSGDITIDSASGNVSFSGDSLINITNLETSGTTEFNGIAYTWPGTDVPNGVLTTNGSGSLNWIGGNGSGISGFWQRNSNVMSPTNITDAINLGGTATSSAEVHLAGTPGDSSFFLNSVAIGFDSDATPITNEGVGGGFTILQVDGDILPAINDDAFLGRASTAWNRLYLSNGINNAGGTEQINILNRQLTGGQWNATSVLRVGDTTASMPSGQEFYVVGDASVSATFTAGGNSRIIGDLATDGNVTIGAGTGKLDVGTVDPPYTINGEKYATYLSGMIGVKEEVTGNIITDEYISGIGYRKTINFNNQEKGSDLWLFGKTTNLKENFNRMSVLLTPKGQAKTWYQVDENKKTLYVYASSPSEISFRLSAPRFDDASWTNARTSGVSGFVINDPDLPENQNTQNEDNSYSAQIANIDGIYKLIINSEEKREISSFSESLIANLKAGSAVISNLLAENLSLTGRLVSPIADIEQLNANNATISGTLFANNIEGKTIDKLNQQLNLLDAKYSTASSILADLQNKYTQYDNLFGTYSEASFSASTDPLQLSPLSTTSATIPSDLSLNSINAHTIYSDDLLANGSVFTKSLSSFDTDLYIQPNGDKPVHLLANLMTLYPNGQVVINGDLIVTGNIFANNLDTRTATVSGTLAVGKGEIATDSSKLLAIFNQNGDVVSSVDASGSANFGQLTTNGLVIAANNNFDASSSAETGSNSTIGTATIATSSSEIFIASSKVTDGTLIYITPVSDTSNQVLYVKSKQIGSGFTVAVPQPLANETSFNYWLVQTK